MDNGLLTYAEAGTLLDRAPAAVRWHIRQGRLHPVRLFGRWLLPRAEVEALAAYMKAENTAGHRPGNKQ